MLYISRAQLVGDRDRTVHEKGRVQKEVLQLFAAPLPLRGSDDLKYDKFRSVCSCYTEYFGSLHVRTDEGYEPNECKQRLTSWHGMCMSGVL